MAFRDRPDRPAGALERCEVIGGGLGAIPEWGEGGGLLLLFLWCFFIVCLMCFFVCFFNIC